jgi:hypothetical protein
MGRACGTNEGKEKVMQVWVCKPEGKTWFGTQKNRLDYNIKKVISEQLSDYNLLKKAVFHGVDYIKSTIKQNIALYILF